MMGSPDGELGRGRDERQHQVTLTRGFYMQTTEVTQGQWKRVMGTNPSGFQNCGDDCPVENVSWDDAQAFIRKLNQMEGRRRYRLPTEAEWEYAARAGSRTAYSWGNEARCENMMFENDVGSSEDKCVEYVRRRGMTPDSTAPVGSYAPNAWGLYDMHGNVWEWCSDWYGDYPSGSVTDPVGPSSGSNRVLRGGSWDHPPGRCQSVSRCGHLPGHRYNHLGFRLACEIPTDPTKLRKFAATVQAAKVDADPDRRAAQWVLSVGGRVTIETAGDKWDVTEPADLPAHAFSLVEISLKNRTSGVTDAGVAILKGLKDLRFLNLYNTHTTDAGIECLKGMTKLTELYVGATRITDAGLVHLKGLTSLF